MTKAISITRNEDARVNGYDRVLAFLREQLLTGSLKTGDRLLPERELAGALGVGRPVIREALRTLATLGAVEIRRGFGTVVKEPDFTALADYFSLVLAQQANVVDDVMQARIAIERHAIRLACTRALPADIERIAQAVKKIEDTLHDPVRGGAADFAFHALIVEAAHSPTLSSVYAAVAKLLQQSHTERRKAIVNVPRISRYLVDHHALIFKAIERRATGEAEMLLTEHFAIGASLRKAAGAEPGDGRGSSAITARRARPAAVPGKRTVTS